MVKIAIVEDEAEQLSYVLNIIENYCPEALIVGTANNAELALKLLENNTVDLALLDINIPGGTTFEVLKQIPNTNFKIIFLTAYEEFALQAIKFSAFDFLLKPVDPITLVRAIQNVSLQIENDFLKTKLETLFKNISNILPQEMVIVLKTTQNVHLVTICDILRCESDSSYTRFHLLDKQTIYISHPLKDYDDLLSPSGFIRVHQSHLVNIRHIKKFDKSDGGSIVLRDGSNIPVATRKKEQLLKAMDEWSKNRF